MGRLPGAPGPVAWRALLPDLVLLEGGTRTARDEAVRAVLANMLNEAEAGLRTGRTGRGKPVLLAPVGASYSVSRSGDLLLVGTARNAACGVDLEVIRRDLPVLDVAESFFAPNEAAFIRTQSKALQPWAFFALWTAKEAVLKATGEGVAGGLRTPHLGGDALTPLLNGARFVKLDLGAGVSVALLTADTGSGAVIAAHATIRQHPSGSGLEDRGG